MSKKIKSNYAIACALDDESFDSIFFVTFNTTDEKEALMLSSCVVGKQRADKCLVVIDEDGAIYEI